MGYENQEDELPVADEPSGYSSGAAYVPEGEPIVETPTAPESPRIMLLPPITAHKLDGLTVAQLRQYAAEQGIDLSNAKKHSAIIRAILAAQPTEAESSAPEFGLSGLYEHMPPGFLEALTNALHARGIVDPSDYFKPGAGELFRSAMLSVIKHDFLSAQALAKTAWIEKATRREWVK